MKRKKITVLILALCTMFITGACGTSDPGYIQISQEEAKDIMDSGAEHIILDVRTQEECDAGHIPNSILIPDYDIKEKAEEILTDKEATILVYCRSGNRSKTASAALADLGYKDVREFGGINDWSYEVVK